MFEAIRKQRIIIHSILALIVLSFALWGVGDYIRDVGSTNEVAEVGDSVITQQDLQKALRDQQERLRQTLGDDFDPAILNRPEARQALLDNLVRQRLIQLEAREHRIAVSDDQLREVISSIPALQEDGRFSMERYASALRSQGLTQAGFEAELRQDLAVQQLVAAVSGSAIVPRASAERWVNILLQEREVSQALIRPEQFVGKVNITPEAVKEYYERNVQQFQVPEAIRVEYVVLSQDKLAEDIKVSDDEVKAWYQSNADRYKQPEERRASHILIQVPKDAPEAEVEAARKKAEELLGRVRKNPGDFAKLAKEFSQDPGSAANGGDLGFFGRGAMVKPFEDTVFALKPGEISDVVKTDFGFHIIRVTEVRAEKAAKLEELKPRIVSELKEQAAAKKFAESAETFSNLVYEQADSLKPAAEKFNLSIEQSGFFSRTDRDAAGPLGDERVMQALFSEDAIKNRRNIEAVETAPRTLVSARVVEHKPATTRPLDSVQGEIETRLKTEEAARLARAEGEAKLAQLQKGEAVDVAWGKARSIQRGGGPQQGVPADALAAIFRAPVDDLPAYTSAALLDGSYALFKITKIKQPEIAQDDPRLAAQRAQLAQLAGTEDFNAYLVALRNRHGVEINTRALMATE